MLALGMLLDETGWTTGVHPMLAGGMLLDEIGWTTGAHPRGLQEDQPTC